MNKIVDVIRGLLGLQTSAAREARALEDQRQQAAMEHMTEKTERRKQSVEVDDKLADALDIAFDELIDDWWEWWGSQGETAEEHAIDLPQPEQQPERESEEMER